MRLISKQVIVVYLAALALSGCATYVPLKMYEGEIKNKKEVATILGQNYKQPSGHSVDIFVTMVDGRYIYDFPLRVKIPYVIQVHPGDHELTLHGSYITNTLLLHSTPPKIRINVGAGEVYQIAWKPLNSDNRGMKVQYTLRHVGSIEQYEDYLAKHPQYEPGSYLPTLVESTRRERIAPLFDK